jgi:hypothetical protein
LAIAAIRESGHSSTAIRVLQFVPSVGLLIGLAVLVELATGAWSPAAGDNATGVATVIAVAEAMRAAPPQNLALEVVLCGAGDAEQVGLRRYLSQRRRRRRRRRRTPSAGPRMIVLAVAASGTGTPHWWQSDGALLPLRYSATLRGIAARLAQDETHLQLSSHRGRSNCNAYAARAAGLPALTIGCLDAHAAVPESHRKTDTIRTVQRGSLERTIHFALLLLDAIDAEVGKGAPRPRAPAA